LALAFAHPWIALFIVVAASVLFASAIWWLWRRLRRMTSGRARVAPN
jgi:ABC-type nickel/cobalt efflux system permease component RcnA